MDGSKTREQVWNTDDPSAGILRLHMTAQSRYDAEVLAGAKGDDAVRSLILEEIDERPRFAAMPQLERMLCLILGKRCVLTTSLSEGRTNGFFTNPPALRVEGIKAVSPKVMKELRAIAYRPEREHFDLRIAMHPSDQSFIECAYRLTKAAEWYQYGGRISQRLMEIIHEGPYGHPIPPDARQIFD